QTQAVELRGACNIVAPVSGLANKEIQRSEIKQGVREIIVCKGTDSKVGMSVRAINKGVFCGYIRKGSPAAIAGLRFGDQILQIDGATCAGWTADQFNKAVKSANPKKISLAIRDRPFERIITMQKDSQGHIGFGFKNGEISHIVKDSSAARNGVLINHNLIEVNGKNVVGMKYKDIQ
ncbi:PDZ domain-containing protein, partial [Salmonella sp. s54836]|uniref:PDZ domain-containing protein n=1 Tax=Salmonella sp. s54836 TaxID=3159673 RepID=UPI003980CD27